MMVSVTGQTGSEPGAGPIHWRAPYPIEIEPQMIRHFAHGCGDYNPRWTGADAVLPPAAFMATITDEVGEVFPPGTLVRWREAHWSLNRAPGSGMAVRTEADIVIDPAGKAARIDVRLLQGDFEFGQGRIIVELLRPVGKPSPRRPPNGYDSDLVVSIEDAMTNEHFTLGALPAHATGTHLPEVVRGPANVHDVAYFLAGWDFLPAGADPLEDPRRAYFDDEFACQHGLAGCVIPSGLQAAWMLTAVTNWLGSGARVAEVSIIMQEPVIHGDIVRVGARVTGSSGHRLEVSVEAVNQANITVSRAELIVYAA